MNAEIRSSHSLNLSTSYTVVSTRSTLLIWEKASRFIIDFLANVKDSKALALVQSYSREFSHSNSRRTSPAHRGGCLIIKEIFYNVKRSVFWMSKTSMKKPSIFSFRSIKFFSYSMKYFPCWKWFNITNKSLHYWSLM